MKTEPLDNWGFGSGVKLTRQELVEQARGQYIRAENIRKSNDELIAKNNALKAENAELREALEKIITKCKEDDMWKKCLDGLFMAFKEYNGASWPRDLLESYIDEFYEIATKAIEGRE